MNFNQYVMLLFLHSIISEFVCLKRASLHSFATTCSIQTCLMF